MHHVLHFACTIAFGTGRVHYLLHHAHTRLATGRLFTEGESLHCGSCFSGLLHPSLAFVLSSVWLLPTNGAAAV